MVNLYLKVHGKLEEVNISADQIICWLLLFGQVTHIIIIRLMFLEMKIQTLHGGVQSAVYLNLRIQVPVQTN